MWFNIAIFQLLRRNPEPLLSLENLAQHKNFKKVSIYRHGLSENMSLIKSIISPPFLLRSKQSGLTNPSTRNWKIPPPNWLRTNHALNFWFLLLIVLHNDDAVLYLYMYIVFACLWACAYVYIFMYCYIMFICLCPFYNCYWSWCGLAMYLSLQFFILFLLHFLLLTYI